MPKTVLGKWSVWMGVAFVVLLGTLMSLAASGQTGGETFSDNLLLSIPALGAGIAAIATFVLGALAIWKQRERAWLVYLTTVIGFLVLLFLVGEFTTPH